MCGNMHHHREHDTLAKTMTEMVQSDTSPSILYPGDDVKGIESLGCKTNHRVAIIMSSIHFSESNRGLHRYFWTVQPATLIACL